MSSESHGVSAAQDERVALSAQHIKSLFPFHVILDEQMRILHHGDKITQLCPLLAIPDQFSKHLRFIGHAAETASRTFVNTSGQCS